MTPEEQREQRDELVEFGNTTIASMLLRANQSPDPVAFSALYDKETGKRKVLVIATIDPKIIALFEQVLALPVTK
jgi:hypothetical protein